MVMNKKWMLLVVFVATGIMAMAVPGEDLSDGPKIKEIPGPAYSLNGIKSTLYWEGSKPGGTHHGTIEVINGTAVSDGKLISEGSFEIDMNSIRNEDVERDEMRDKLVNHLKSEDFFYTEKYPKASFVITEVNALSGDRQQITGDLTIRGITHEISFPAQITMDDQMIHAKTEEIVLDRTRWEVNFKSKSIFAGLKDSFIKDEMIVKLDIHFNKP